MEILVTAGLPLSCRGTGDFAGSPEKSHVPWNNINHDQQLFLGVVDVDRHGGNPNRIIFNGVTMHTGTAVTTIGANGHRADLFYVPYGIMERIQVTVFFIQELILSSLYLWKSKSFLGLYRRHKGKGGTVQRKKRSMVIHLILTNVIVVVRTYTFLFIDSFMRPATILEAPGAWGEAR